MTPTDEIQIRSDGTIEYRRNGVYHREDGPAVIYDYPPSKKCCMWFLDGKRHRLDGPAVEWSDGSTEWWYQGLIHRLDGPAIEHSDGSEWWYMGLRFIDVVSVDDFQTKIKETLIQEILEA